MPTDLSKITTVEAADQAINRRAEMWMKTKEWLEDPAGAQIPDSDQPAGRRLRSTGSPYDSHTRLKLEAKDRMRARGMVFAVTSGMPWR